MEFPALVITVLGVTVTSGWCDACDKLREEQWEITRAAALPATPSRAGRFKQLAIEAGFARYLDYDPAKAPPWMQDEYPLDKGFLFIGTTGLGKTFTAVEIMRRLHAAGKTVHLVDSIELGMSVSTQDGERREAAIGECLAADWLLIDDLAKAVISPRVAEALFHIANRRENFDRKTIWTTNATSDQIAARLPPEIADPFLERLARTTGVVIFE